MSDYQPVSCELYDRLELLLSRRQRVEWRLQDMDAGERVVVGRAVDLYSRDAQEFVCLEEGTAVRLDRLLGVLPLD